MAKTPDPPDKFSVEFAEASGLGWVGEVGFLEVVGGNSLQGTSRMVG